jgi:hypothetical protein
VRDRFRVGCLLPRPHAALSGRGLKTYNHNRDACYRSEVTFSDAGGGRHSSARRAPPRRSGAIRRRVPHRTRGRRIDPPGAKRTRSAPDYWCRWFGGEPSAACRVTRAPATALPSGPMTWPATVPSPAGRGTAPTPTVINAAHNNPVITNLSRMAVPFLKSTLVRCRGLLLAGARARSANGFPDLAY